MTFGPVGTHSYTPPPPPPKTSITGTNYAADHWETVFKCKYEKAEACSFKSTEFALRYHLWQLLGLPVWLFEFKYDLTEVYLDNGIKQVSITQTAGNEVSLFTNGVPVLYVPVSLFRRIRLSSEFNFKLLHRSDINENICTSIQHLNPGILERQGEWGWDVPGSPDWHCFV